LREALAERTRFVDTEKRRDIAVGARVHALHGCQWRATGVPDALVLPQQSQLSPETGMLEEAAVLLFELSAGHGATVDHLPAALDALLCGLILECSKEAWRRECTAAGKPLPGGLSRPTLTVCVPAGWGKLKHADAQAAAELCRVGEFRWDGFGVAYRRSKRQSLLGALRFAFSNVHA
jgi:hypothetical protein